MVRAGSDAGFGQNRLDAALARKVGGCESDLPEFSGVRDFGDGFLRDGICVVRSESRGGAMRAGVHLGDDSFLRCRGGGGGAGAAAGSVFRSG